ncbi:MAG: AAA family ATPase, partial [Alphaproteobacteria bacterium]|nr:AAA family ATPase [Alphaproteobacteria bacterium]
FRIPEGELGALVDAAVEAGSDGAILWDACRTHARPRLAALTRPVPVRARFDDLVLPDHHTRMLQSIALVLRHRVKVLHDWGFAEHGAGPGVSAVFAGPSGTGKTMAAEALANAARLDLYRVELGAVLGASLAQTEAKLGALFDAAEVCGAVLLFDDADALFGAGRATRRTELELGYLIQRMDAYQGATIFTTSPREAFDSELLRRA